MKKGVKRLRRCVGGAVQQMLVEVLFFGVEPRGSIGSIVIEMEGGQRVYLGCAGDGGVLVLDSPRSEPGMAPGFVKVDRAVAAVRGPLSSVEVTATSLALRIGGIEVEIRNADDELVLLVEGEPAGKSLLER